MRKIDWQKYLLTFLITAAIFGTAIYASDYFNNKRLDEVKSIQDNLSIDLESSETQFDLLKEVSCSNVDNSVLTDELNSLSSKLDYMETSLGKDNSDVDSLKKTYSLLEIRDYLLTEDFAKSCTGSNGVSTSTTPLSIVYFYSNAGDCADCTKEGYVLTYLREQYPTLRVYSFDNNIDLSAVQTLAAMNNISSSSLPALIIDNKQYFGFKDVDQVKGLIPELAALDAEAASSSEATSTASSSESSTTANL
jgi:hypothetical protein